MIRVLDMLEGFCISGFDPGSKGAIGFIDPINATLDVYDLPIMTVSGGTRKHTYVDHVRLGAIMKLKQPIHSYTEDVHTTPQMGVVSAGTFMRNFGTLIGCHGPLEIPLSFVRPQVWKKTLGVPADKKEAVARAGELFPACVHLFTRPDRAEASLVALYGVLALGHKLTKRITPFIREPI